MKTLDANDWEYIEARKKAFIANIAHSKSAPKKKKHDAKRDKAKAIAAANTYMKHTAEQFAKKMLNSPSELEKKMLEFLDNQHIPYDFQKIFYLKDKLGKIFQFFIADFYIKTKNLIIETDGKFHDDQEEYDNWRTKAI